MLRSHGIIVRSAPSVAKWPSLTCGVISCRREAREQQKPVRPLVLVCVLVAGLMFWSRVRYCNRCWIRRSPRELGTASFEPLFNIKFLGMSWNDWFGYPRYTARSGDPRSNNWPGHRRWPEVRIVVVTRGRRPRLDRNVSPALGARPRIGAASAT